MVETMDGYTFNIGSCNAEPEDIISAEVDSKVKIEKRDFSEHGHVIRYYKSSIPGTHLSIKKIKSILTLFEN